MFNIAFFGSDLFSLASFRALLALRSAQPDLISSISLVTRQLKASGRGMKTVVTPAIAEHALEKSVEWHQVESADDFSLLQQRNFNLAVAVSYGTLIPAPFLRSLAFGGLNVHPSILPQYRGASPLQHAIMNRDKSTGVSVQTLDPHRFDHGTVLWRSPECALETRITLPELSRKLSGVGAEGLCKVIENNLKPIEEHCAAPAARSPSKAPRIMPEWSRIDFNMNALDVDARGRALMKLFFEQRVEQRGKRQKGLPLVRVNLADFELVSELVGEDSGGVCEGLSARGETLLAVQVADGYVGAKTVTVQGFKKEPAASYFENREKRRLREVEGR